MSTACTEPGCDRTFNNLYFPEPRCGRHTSDEQRALVDDLDRRARRIGIRNDGWPYGPNIHVPARVALLDWAETERVRYSPRGRCLHWISRGRCAVSVCDEHRQRHSWMDHVTGWTRDGKPAVLVAQPYHVSATERMELTRIGVEWNLDVRVATTGWYGFDTRFVELRPRPAQLAAPGEL